MSERLDDPPPEGWLGKVLTGAAIGFPLGAVVVWILVR